MRLSIVMPVYNETATLEASLVRLLELTQIPDREIIVVDDGSTDGSREFLQRFRHPLVRVLLHPQNRGKGAAIRTALEQVTGDVVAIQDADLEYDPRDLVPMFELVASGKADVVYGSRIRSRAPMSHLRYWIGGVLVTVWTNLLYQTWITDEPTCYKMFRVSVLRSFELECRGFEFCPEVTAKVLRRGLRIREVPIGYSPRKIAQGKKIRFRDGMIAFWTLLKYRFRRI